MIKTFNKNFKKIIVIGIIIVLGIILGYSWHNYRNALVLMEAKKQYNEDQEACKIVGNTLNYIYLKEYYSKKQEGSIWELTNLDNKKSYQFKVKNGIRGLVGLEKGSYKLKEISAPEGVTLNENEYYFNFSEYNHSYAVDTLDSGGAFLLVAKNEKGEPVKDIKFNFYSNDGVLLHEITTNEDGAVAIINLISEADKIFYVEQANIDNPQRFYVRIGKDEVHGLNLIVNDEGVAK